MLSASEPCYDDCSFSLLMCCAGCWVNWQVVDVSFNAIKELPASATKLVSLHTLVASCNLLETLPEGLLAAATALTRLELAENSLYK